VYVGSVQTLEYVVADELLRKTEDDGMTDSKTKAQAKARLLLLEHTTNFQWLASLAGEGHVFESDDPEDEQLILA
jgi:hypothetical protein